MGKATRRGLQPRASSPGSRRSVRSRLFAIPSRISLDFKSCKTPETCQWHVHRSKLRYSASRLSSVSRVVCAAQQDQFGLGELQGEPWSAGVLLCSRLQAQQNQSGSQELQDTREFSRHEQHQGVWLCVARSRVCAEPGQVTLSLNNIKRQVGKKACVLSDAPVARRRGHTALPELWTSVDPFHHI